MTRRVGGLVLLMAGALLGGATFAQGVLGLRRALLIAPVVAGVAPQAARAAREGFTETPSGLQYKVLLDGDGPIPTTGQRIKADYTGWLDDFESDKKFDSSRDRRQPLEFQVGIGKVIKGWDEALLSMKVGERHAPANARCHARAVMALAKFSEDLAKALKEQGTPVESALESPEDTPKGDAGRSPTLKGAPGASLGFSFLTQLGLSSASSSSTGSPPSPRAERAEADGADGGARFLFGGTCLRPHKEGSLGCRSVEERVEAGRRLRASKLKPKPHGGDEPPLAPRDAASSLMRSAAAAVVWSSPSPSHEAEGDG